MILARCVRCHRLIWPWQHFAFYVVASGRDLRWHASHSRYDPQDRRLHLTRDDSEALARSAGEEPVGWIEP